MIARVATFDPAPTDDRTWVLEALRGVPGVHSAYHMRDPERGTVLSISIYDSEEGPQAALEAIRARAQAIGHEGRPPDDLRMYEVIGHIENS